MIALEKTFHEMYGLVPDDIRKGIGEFLWNLNHKVLYISTGAKEKTVQLKDVEISYIELGNIEKPTLVIVHGFSDSKEGFLSLAGHLARDFHILIPDLPGFGKSSKPNCTYSLELYSEWLLEFLNYKKVYKFHSLGNSMGGAILIEYAHRHPDMLESIVLSCAAGLVPEEEGSHFYDDYRSGKNIFIIEEEYHFEEFVGKLFYKKNMVPHTVKHYMFQKYRHNGAWYDKLMNDILGKYVGKDEEEHQRIQREKISSIECPVLILWGSHDGIFPEKIAHQFKEQIPHAALQVVDETGHLPHMEKPKEVREILMNFYEHGQTAKN